MDQSYFWTWSKQTTEDYFELASASSGVMDVTYKGKTSKVIDLSSVSYQASFGHSPEFILSAIRAQMDRFSVASPKASFPLKETVASGLTEKLDIGPGKIYFCNSGSEAIENALKIVRSQKDKKIILSRRLSYHGSTLGSLSISGDWRRDDHKTIDEWNAFIPEPHEDPKLIQTRAIIEEIGAEKIAGFCLETVTGSNGIIIAPESWWMGIQNLCNEFKLGLIIDEVICGFGRTGKPFGINHYPGLKPDMVCMAKAITGGIFPLGAVFASEKYSGHYEDHIFSIGTTNTGHPLAMAAAKAVLAKMNTSDFWENIKVREEILTSFQTRLKKYSHVKETRRLGCLMAIDLETPITWAQAMEYGIYLISAKGKLIIAPALTMSVDEYTEGLHRLDKLIKEYGQKNEA